MAIFLFCRTDLSLPLLLTYLKHSLATADNHSFPLLPKWNLKPPREKILSCLIYVPQRLFKKRRGISFYTNSSYLINSGCKTSPTYATLKRVWSIKDSHFYEVPSHFHWLSSLWYHTLQKCRRKVFALWQRDITSTQSVEVRLWCQKNEYQCHRTDKILLKCFLSIRFPIVVLVQWRLHFSSTCAVVSCSVTYQQ